MGEVVTDRLTRHEQNLKASRELISQTQGTSTELSVGALKEIADRINEGEQKIVRTLADVTEKLGNITTKTMTEEMKKATGEIVQEQAKVLKEAYSQLAPAVVGMGLGPLRVGDVQKMLGALHQFVDVSVDISKSATLGGQAIQEIQEASAQAGKFLVGLGAAPEEVDFPGEEPTEREEQMFPEERERPERIVDLLVGIEKNTSTTVEILKEGLGEQKEFWKGEEERDEEPEEERKERRGLGLLGLGATGLGVLVGFVGTMFRQHFIEPFERVLEFWQDIGESIWRLIPKVPEIPEPVIEAAEAVGAVAETAAKGVVAPIVKAAVVAAERVKRREEREYYLKPLPGEEFITPSDIERLKRPAPMTEEEKRRAREAPRALMSPMEERRRAREKPPTLMSPKEVELQRNLEEAAEKWERRIQDLQLQRMREARERRQRGFFLPGEQPIEEPITPFPSEVEEESQREMIRPGVEEPLRQLDTTMRNVNDTMEGVRVALTKARETPVAGVGMGVGSTPSLPIDAEVQWHTSSRADMGLS